MARIEKTQKMLFIKRNAVSCSPFERFVCFLAKGVRVIRYHTGGFLHVTTPWAAFLHGMVTVKKKKNCTAAEASTNLWGYWQDWRPTSIRRRPWIPWGPLSCNFGATLVMLN